MAVTLVGVVLLLVLAGKAGLLRPEIRVVGGVALSGALVGVGVRLRGRPGGRIGAIALAATGIAAAYLDVTAITTIYHWVPSPVGLVIAAVVGAAGLTLARRWDSEDLGLLVLVPLIGLAPVLTHGVDLQLVAFMLALSAAALPVQLGKDWTWMHAARIAAVTVPLLMALIGTSAYDNPSLIGGACGVAALLALASGLILLAEQHQGNRTGSADGGGDRARARVRDYRQSPAGRGAGGRAGSGHARDRASGHRAPPHRHPDLVGVAAGAGHHRRPRRARRRRSALGGSRIRRVRGSCLFLGGRTIWHGAF